MKILIVGLGSIGKRHLKNISSKTNYEIIVYTKRTDFPNTHKKNIKIFHDLDLCLKENPNVAFITNETINHIPIALKLAKRGLHLFIEKPISNDLKQMKNLLQIVRERKIVTMVGCNFRFHNCIKKIKSLIEQKKIGKIISVKVECGTYLPNWHPYEDYSKGYAARDDLGGGVVLTCIHELDYLYWFFGKIKEVFSITGKFSDLKVSTDDLSAIILKFKNNIIGEVHLDYFQRPEARSCKIIGTNGTIEWNSLSNEVKIYSPRKKKWERVLKMKKEETDKMYLKELEHFLDCVKNKKKSINNFEQGTYLLKTSLEIKKSSVIKKSIMLGE